MSDIGTISSGARRIRVSQAVRACGRQAGGRRPEPVPLLGRLEHQEGPALAEAGRRRPDGVLQQPLAHLRPAPAGRGRSRAPCAAGGRRQRIPCLHSTPPACRTGPTVPSLGWSPCRSCSCCPPSTSPTARPSAWCRGRPAARPPTATRWRPRCSGSGTAPSGCTWSTSTPPSAAGSNRELLARVVGELDVDVELSGGIRDDESLAAALATGCRRVNLGTAALESPEWCARAIAEYGDRIAVGLDVRGTRLAARGWTQEGGELYETLARLDAEGCARYVVTDITKDGTLRGPNLELLREVCAATAAAGDRLGRCQLARRHPGSWPALTAVGVEGAIVGKALYAGAFTLPEALRVTGERPMSGHAGSTPARPGRGSSGTAASSSAGTRPGSAGRRRPSTAWCAHPGRCRPRRPARRWPRSPPPWSGPDSRSPTSSAPGCSSPTSAGGRRSAACTARSSATSGRPARWCRWRR